jgi:5,10-methylenetetrahydrofolate reductase, prokaryotic form
MNKVQISMEIFPPKKDSEFSSAYRVAKELADINPDFISVTYGAGGSRSKSTIEIASYIQNELHIPAMAHLTCVGSTREDISRLCEEFKAHNISNVLALRGDRPKDMSDEQYNSREFTYASNLVDFLKEHTELEIWGACYPEKHFESFSKEADLMHMKEKQDKGVTQFITQLFFDNDFFYEFRDKAARKGITAPIHAGIMPITSAGQIGRSISLSGSSVPKALSDIIAAHGDDPEDMYNAGIDYAIRQCNDLLQNGVDGIHIYTMNKPDVAKQIVKALAI